MEGRSHESREFDDCHATTTTRSSRRSTSSQSQVSPRSQRPLVPATTPMQHSLSSLPSSSPSLPRPASTRQPRSWVLPSLPMLPSTPSSALSPKHASPMASVVTLGGARGPTMRDARGDAGRDAMRDSTYRRKMAIPVIQHSVVRRVRARFVGSSFALIKFIAFATRTVTRLPTAAASQTFSGQWDGKWTKSDDTNYPDNGDGRSERWFGSNRGSSSRSNGEDDDDLWIDNGGMSPEMLIVLLTLGVLALFAILFCCVCYPEIAVAGCTSLRNCFKGGKNTGDGETTLDGEGAYVGGRQDKERRKRMAAKALRGTSKPSSSPSSDVELV